MFGGKNLVQKITDYEKYSMYSKSKGIQIQHLSSPHYPYQTF